MRTRRWRTHAVEPGLLASKAPGECHAPHLQSVLALVAVQYLVCIDTHYPIVSTSPRRVQAATYNRETGSQIPARVQCMSMRPSVAVSLYLRVPSGRGAGACGSTHVDFAILEALL
jgi:hypothetical protein